MASPKFATETCIFCGADSSAHGEHNPPLWFTDRFEGPFSSEVNDVPVVKRDGVTPRIHRSYPTATLPVCDHITGSGCNGTLNAMFEVAAKPVIEALACGRVALIGADVSAFAHWVIKTWLLLAHPKAYLQPDDRFLARWELSDARDNLYGWMVTTGVPPDHLFSWVSRLDPRGSEDGEYGFLPNGAHVAQYAWSFDSAGVLDVSVVYDPSDTVVHPFEADGRAVRLWPLHGSAAVNLGGLPSAGSARWLSGLRPESATLLAALK